MKRTNKTFQERIILAQQVALATVNQEKQVELEKKKQDILDKLKASDPKKYAGVYTAEKAVSIAVKEQGEVTKQRIGGGGSVGFGGGTEVQVLTQAGELRKNLDNLNTQSAELTKRNVAIEKSSADYNAKITTNKKLQYDLDVKAMTLYEKKKKHTQDETDKYNVAKVNVEDYETQHKTTPPTPTELTTAEKQAKKDAEERKKNLIKTEEDLKKEHEKWQNELTKIALDAENVRLSLLDKNSEEYIRKKAEYDRKVIDQEREKWLKIYDLEKGIVVADPNNKNGFKIQSFTETKTKEYVKQGFTKDEAKAKAKTDLSNEFNTNKDAVKARELIALQLEVIARKETDELVALKQKQNNELLRTGTSTEQELQAISDKYIKLFAEYEDNEEIRLALIKKFQDEGLAIKSKEKTNDLSIQKDVRTTAEHKRPFAQNRKSKDKNKRNASKCF